MCGGGLSKIFRGEVCRENVFSHTKQEGTMIAGRGMDEGKRVTFSQMIKLTALTQQGSLEVESTRIEITVLKMGRPT
ncbi:hypothetical protein ACOSQ2_020367 [Xanthoceras sorbifolium]